MDDFENAPQEYKPKKIAGKFNDKYIKHESENDEKLSIKQYFKKIISYLSNKINDQKIILKS